MSTYFAPFATTDEITLKNQIKEMENNHLIDFLLKSISGNLVVINKDRQIIAANHGFLKTLGAESTNEVLGMRLGESLNCIHAKEKPSSCGTTAHCPTCGAAIAMMTAITKNTADEQICAFTAEVDGNPEELCLRVKAQPIIIDNEKYILIFAQDITHEQFLINLEKIFFHDVTNSLNGIIGFSQLLQNQIPDNEFATIINEAATKLNKEIDFQRALANHKDLNFKVDKKQVSIAQIKHDLGLTIEQHPSAKNKSIEASWPGDPLIIETDRHILSRVLGNMLINALEATPKKGNVKLTVEVDDLGSKWQVWNRSSIPEKIQKRIFQKHFSTKSSFGGRGLGTYSMKLFGEQYLGGKLDFSSSKADGTMFSLSLPS